MTARKKQTDDIETYADVKVLQDWRKSVDDHLKDIDDKLSNLPDVLIEKLDERYAAKKDVEEIKETVAPFTTWRKKMWAGLVGIIVIGALELALLSNWIKEITK